MTKTVRVAGVQAAPVFLDASARAPVTWKRSPAGPSGELEPGILADA